MSRPTVKDTLSEPLLHCGYNQDDDCCNYRKSDKNENALQQYPAYLSHQPSCGIRSGRSGSYRRTTSPMTITAGGLTRLF